MPITIPDVIVEKGKTDAKRHREKQKDIIKANLPKIIAEESIITSKRGKIVKVQIKGIEIPYFRPGKKGNSIGFGQGEGKPGDIIGRKPGQQPGQAGNEPGEDYIETEVPLEEIIEMMLEDLGLPRLEEKELKSLLVEIGFKIAGRDKTGIWPLLDKKSTRKQGMRRFWFVLRALAQETGRPELICFEAMKKTNGDFDDSLKLLRDPNFVFTLNPEKDSIQPFAIFATDDLRFFKLDPEVKEQSQAVILALMDVSGSMTTEKKYLARSMLFWLTEFLRKIYEKVEIRFIIHHATAKMVEEEQFFQTGESGGTLAHTAFEITNSLVDTEYPTNQHNVYVWYFGDGDDFDPIRAVEEIKKLLTKGINMFGYGEIDDLNQSPIDGSSLMKVIKKNFATTQIHMDDLEMQSGKNEPLLTMTIKKRAHLLPALKQFLKKDRWAGG